MAPFRTEHDSMGDVQVRSDRYWGAQTQRSLENFKIGGQRFPRSVIHALGIVKKAAARANVVLEKLPEEKATLIVQAADRVISGELDDQFPLVVWQTGSGTQTNMNANEVIANVANEIAGAARGSNSPIHPNDHVNMSQSSNDVFPTVMHVASALRIHERLEPAVALLARAIDEKIRAFGDIVKVGRTHLMDATPLTLGQEMSGWSALLEFSRKRLVDAESTLLEIALGGTAVGTGLNSSADWPELAAKRIAELTGLSFKPASNKFAALSAHDAMLAASSATRGLATACMKIASDVRLLASGPRTGIGELILPENEPGSSIMPGKVNPTQCEAMTMVCVHVMGLDAAIGFAGASGQLQLNAMKPVILHDLLESIELLADACDSFRERCIDGMEPDRAVIAKHVNASLMLATALSPSIGYDAAAKIARDAHAKGTTLREAAIASRKVTAEKFDELVKAENMIAPDPSKSR